MPSPLLLHVGTMKSGTSYLQRRLDHNRSALAGQGILFPGRTWGAQVHAVGDLLGRGRLGGDSAKRAGAWLRLVEEVQAHDGPAIVSVELLGAAGPARIEAALASFADRDVRVVITARDLNRNLLAMWQEGLQNGRTVGWDEYCEGVRTNTGPGGRFWREQDLARMVARWAEHVGPRNVTLVTVPPPAADPELLWQRFCSVAGIAPDTCGAVAPANQSLGAGSAMVMLRVNETLAAHGVPWREYNALVKRGLAKEVLAAHRSDEPPLGLPVARWLRRRSRQMVRQLEELAVPVVGDLADLRPAAVPGVRPGTVSSQRQVEAAVHGLVGLLLRQATSGAWHVDEDDQVDRVLEGAGA